MRKSCLLGAVCACVIAFISTSSNAALFSRFGGLAVYDTDLNITWLTDGNYMETDIAGSDARVNQIILNVGSVDGHTLTTADFYTNGLGIYDSATWWGAMAWADQLSVGGFDVWRLTTAPELDPTCSIQGASLSYNKGCTGSEFGHLVSIELASYTPFNDGNTHSLGPIHNIESGWYWQASTFNDIWGRSYHILTADQISIVGKGGYGLVLPVADGDVLPSLLRCDVNSNGEVDVGDLSQVLRMVLDNIADDLDCDINNGGFGDGVISTADLVIVTRIVMGIIPAISN
jgi:hypothetical protein